MHRTPDPASRRWTGWWLVPGGYCDRGRLADAGLPALKETSLRRLLKVADQLTARAA